MKHDGFVESTSAKYTMNTLCQVKLQKGLVSRVNVIIFSCILLF